MNTTYMAPPELPILTCLTKPAIIRMPQLLLNNEDNSMILPQLASIMLLLSQPQENVIDLLCIIPFWFHTHPDWFLKRARDNWKLWAPQEGCS